ncbi:MAG: M23 family metallopeptidase [Clostridia bacterium]|nr:M23 family metallopeptidase [Clostridia bacterium]
MEKPFNSLKANRILYVSVVAALCVVAIVIGIVAAASRPSETEPPAGTDNTPGTENQNPSPDQPTGGEGEEIEFLCPLSGTVSKRHDTESLVFSSTMGDWRVHTGVDITTSLGAVVSCVADGTVKEVFDDAMMGKCVSVSHADGVVSIYRNLDEVLADGIAAGASISEGDAIGTVGESALCELADEPHLHFEMTVNGAPVDPLTLLSEESRAACLTEEDKVYEN